MYDVINQFKRFSLDYDFYTTKRIKYKRKAWKELWYMKVLRFLMPNDFSFNPGGCDYV